MIFKMMTLAQLVIQITIKRVIMAKYTNSIIILQMTMMINMIMKI